MAICNGPPQVLPQSLEEGWGPAHFAALSGSVASLEVLDGMLEDEDLEGERPAHKA